MSKTPLVCVNSKPYWFKRQNGEPKPEKPSKVTKQCTWANRLNRRKSKRGGLQLTPKSAFKSAFPLDSLFVRMANSSTKKAACQPTTQRQSIGECASGSGRNAKVVRGS